MIPLALIRDGERVKVLKISGGRGLVRRMTDLGLRPGAEIEIISASRNGSFIIRLGEQRLGVGFGVAKKIFVDLVV